MGTILSYGSNDTGDERHLCHRELPGDRHRARLFRSKPPQLAPGAIFRCSCGVDYTLGYFGFSTITWQPEAGRSIYMKECLG